MTNSKIYFKPAINEYYLAVLNDMIDIINKSKPGKRIWKGRNYNLTERSTFPMWVKFFYVCTPKKIAYDKNNYKLGYFNGNTREVLRILNNSKSGYISKSERVIKAFTLMIEGYIQEIREYEIKNNYYYYEKYFIF